tara:strand:- start:49 stop:669 length:621 start_codon:yes stop_codon:yes gene_type:complete
MNIFELFPTPVYKFSLSNHKKYKEKIMKPLLEKYNSNTPTSAFWASGCNSCQIDLRELNLDLHDVYDEIMEGFKKYLDYLEVQADRSFSIMESWFNVHTYEMYQEEHGHMPNFISGTYYIQFDPEKDNALTFLNNNKEFIYSAWSMNIPVSRSTLNNSIQLDVKEGDVLLFPSTLHHLVLRSKQKHDNLRITNSFNIVPFAPRMNR